MNKQEIEQKLEEIVYKDKELIENIVDGKLSYGVATSFLEELCKQSFNLALDIAAENVKTNSEDCKIWNCEGMSVDKESILKYKL